MEPTGSLISRRIRVALAERESSAAELARRIGMTQSYVARRMRGDVEWRTTDLELIAAELQLDVADLIGKPAVNAA